MKVNKKTTSQQQFDRTNLLKNGPKPSGKKLRKIEKKRKIAETEEKQTEEYDIRIYYNECR